MIKDIKSNENTFVLLKNGDLWDYGENRHGELGHGYEKRNYR